MARQDGYLSSLRPEWLAQRTNKKPVFLEQRSSRGFITATVAVAVFTDIFLYAVIVPVMPFAISERCDIPPDRVQYWITVLVAVYGAATLLGSRESNRDILAAVRCILTSPQRSPDILQTTLPPGGSLCSWVYLRSPVRP